MSDRRKEVNALIKVLRRPEHGLIVPDTVSTSGHWKVTKPGHRAVFIASSPSDHRALNNIRRDLRKFLGVDI